jgi:rhodanese-related sulfurtransferase
MSMGRVLTFVVLLGVLLLAGCGAGQAEKGAAPASDGGSAAKGSPSRAQTSNESVGQQTSVPGGSFTRLSPNELKTKLEDKDVTLVNVHVPFEGDIPGTDLSIPYSEIGQKKYLDRLPGKDATIVLYCKGGPMSLAAAETLVKLGYGKVADLEGGMDAWRATGLPLKGT